jgi:hypothetical protein
MNSEMRFSPLLAVAVIGGLALLRGCGPQQPPTVPTLQPGESLDSAMARFQSDPTKSPQEKVLEIDVLQRQFAGVRGPVHHKRLNRQ